MTSIPDTTTTFDAELTSSLTTHTPWTSSEDSTIIIATIPIEIPKITLPKPNKSKSTPKKGPKTHKITPPNPQKSKPASKNFTKIQPARNHSAVSEPSTRKKKSSSLSLILLLILFLCAIIGSAVFFIVRHLRKQHSNDDQTLLNRVNSDESNYSETDESETSTVTEGPPQPEPHSEQIPAKAAGRTVNRFDPDEM